MPLPTVWDPVVRQSFLRRVATLGDDARPAWGKLSAAGMLAHINDSYRLALGELAAEPRNLPIRFTPLRQLIVYLLPIPKNLPTVREMIARVDTASMEVERPAFSQLIRKLGQLAVGARLTPHPSLGNLSYKEYGVLMAKHTGHHLKQFGL